MSDVEVIGASSWESTTPQSPQASFTQAIIDELRKVSPAPISATQLVSQLHSTQSVVRNRSMPVHKLPLDLDQPPALIHRIEKTPTPPPTQSTAVPRFSHVLIGVTVEKEDTVPDKAAWATWLTTNLPPYVGQIDIQASWKTGSAFVIFVMPIEIWLGLPEREAYVFLEYHRGWDAAAAARAQRALCQPPPPPTRGTDRGVGRGIAGQSSSQLQSDENVRPGTGTGSGARIPQRMPQPGHETPLVLPNPNVPRPDEQKDSR
ncbi:hypothetical protein HRG_005497 [Hirsutella rhossiliensis]|uniref:Uncharacterized protein n=1 Tax=Hirsutella rhossiliensis TaxID=111463 RepID=A0A9P8MX64_9HYPO|nr:uncharacterized protein HRG_05497 [Hirsutella rhossiliensis]KAH0962987.1 hypothetical protein HRG_05497 [Hirsutella rhossiliensis]